MQTVAVILAAGSGSRFGAAEPKQLRVLAGQTLIQHCVQAFDQAPGIDHVLVVTSPAIAPRVRADLAGYGKVRAVIHGGTSRTDSTRQAIAWLKSGPAGPESKVLFHDAARPLVSQQIIADCVVGLDRWQALGVVVPSSDTVVEVTAGQIGRVLPRDALGRCQTPQAFLLSVISRAYERADADPEFASAQATDDCGVVLRYLPEVAVGAVRGSELNLKVTYPADLAIARALLEAGEQVSQETPSRRHDRPGRGSAGW
jgi:2-C-methyl-D-erythritol 4-phosphate cytidylyltransferase